MKKQVIGFVVFFVLILTLFQMSAFAFDDTSGTYGENLTWALTRQTAT